MATECRLIGEVCSRGDVSSQIISAHQISQQQQVCHLGLICDGAYNPPLDEAQYSWHVL